MLAPLAAWRAAGLGLIACALPLSVGQAQVVLGPDQLRIAATQELRVGAPDRALRYAKALTDRDATDLTAWLVQGRAHRTMGDYTAARKAARTAWSLADTDEERYASALIMAQALSSDGRRTAAQLWLRRAGHHAPTPELEARAKDHFRYVQSRNPWRTDFTFTFAPTSNVNNGSSKDRSRLNYQITDLLFGTPVEYQLSGASQALSGLELGATVNTRYRFRESASSADEIFAKASYRTFVLSDSARRDAPGVSGSDFAYGTLEFGWRHLQMVQGGKAEHRYEISAGQSWYGGDRYASYAIFGASRTVALTPRSQLVMSAQLREEVGQNTFDRRTFNIEAGVSRRLDSGAQLSLSTGVATTASPRNEAEYDELRLRASYRPKSDIMGVQMQYGLTARWRDYDVSRHDASGRTDMSLFADATATFKDIDYYGFNPAVTVRGNFTDSNINLFDLEQVTVGLGIRSEF